MHSRSRTGFTLVELVIVLLLLGVLLVMALPRFMASDKQVAESRLRGVVTGLQTGVRLFRSQWVALGEPGPGVVMEEFSGLRSTAFGYPAGRAVTATLQDCEDVWNGLLQSTAPSISTVVATDAIMRSPTEFTAWRDGALCHYYFSGVAESPKGDVEVITYDPDAGYVSRATQVLTPTRSRPN